MSIAGLTVVAKVVHKNDFLDEVLRTPVQHAGMKKK